MRLSNADRCRQRRAQLQPYGPIISCVCDCGGTLNTFDRDGRPRRLIQGHRIVKHTSLSKPRLIGGYLYVFRPEHPKAHHGWMLQHVAIAEAALGKHMPPKAEVHHVNGIGSDNRRSNLVICENHAYHRLLHSRQRVMNCGGDPDTEKVCGICGQPKPFSAFHANRSRSDGYRTECRECRNPTRRRRPENALPII